MPRAPHTQSHDLLRLMRSHFMRCVAAAAMIPILILSSLGGTTLLAHAHDGHGIHFHIAPSPDQARLSAQHHRLFHALHPHTCDESAIHDHEHHQACDHAHDPIQVVQASIPQPLQDSHSLIITIPDQEPISPRATHLVAIDLQSHLLLLTTLLAWVPPVVADESGSPGGITFPAPPRHLSRLSASQRLVRVNRALLL